MKLIPRHEKHQIAAVENWLRDEHPDATSIFVSGGEAEVRETLQEAAPGKPLVEQVSFYAYGSPHLHDAQLAEGDICVFVKTYEAIDRHDQRPLTGFAPQDADPDLDYDDDAPLGAYTLGEDEDEYL
jgi:hypothetical protein